MSFIVCAVLTLATAVSGYLFLEKDSKVKFGLDHLGRLHAAGALQTQLLQHLMGHVLPHQSALVRQAVIFVMFFTCWLLSVGFVARSVLGSR
ncbi:MAG: hypothetical protein HY397_03755 [Candidatus Doudnabacteria bacterium]|nr:hypothetical protein [Candidatus Doudnabacteria bacterium]